LDNRLVLICCRKFHKFQGYRVSRLLPFDTAFDTNLR
jgi:hypothetical protein